MLQTLADFERHVTCESICAMAYQPCGMWKSASITLGCAKRSLFYFILAYQHVLHLQQLTPTLILLPGVKKEMYCMRNHTALHVLISSCVPHAQDAARPPEDYQLLNSIMLQ